MKTMLGRIVVGVVLGVVTLSLSGCGLRTSETKYRMNLEVWGVFDDSDAFQQVIGKYKEMNTNVGEIVYRKFNVDTYRQDLLDALAAGMDQIFSWCAILGRRLLPTKS
jgi:hypothetical protein